MRLDSPAVTDAEIYAEHATALVRFATVLVGPNDAADVVSSAVLRVLSSPGWTSVTNQRSYLHQAVANEARNFRRGETRRHDRETRVPTASVSYPREVHPEVRAAVARLSVRQRATVYLAYWEDMTDHMIADYLGISAGSVRRHLARARNHLRRALNEDR
ncbi:RNA polymerase sigma-E factor [bacterium BMS3Bbin02]|nr:RNA polymerase sigma-E factor [bacterium BMS3Bbin02]